MTGAKFKKAQEWYIPVIDRTWLEQMVREGIVPAVVVAEAPSSSSSSDVARALRMAAVALQDTNNVKSQGKGKGKETDLMMVDITNSKFGRLK